MSYHKGGLVKSQRKGNTFKKDREITRILKVLSEDLVLLETFEVYNTEHLESVIEHRKDMFQELDELARENYDEDYHSLEEKDRKEISAMYEKENPDITYWDLGRIVEVISTNQMGIITGIVDKEMVKVQFIYDYYNDSQKMDENGVEYLLKELRILDEKNEFITDETNGQGLSVGDEVIVCGIEHKLENTEWGGVNSRGVITHILGREKDAFIIHPLDKNKYHQKRLGYRNKVLSVSAFGKTINSLNDIKIGDRVIFTKNEKIRTGEIREIWSVNTIILSGDDSFPLSSLQKFELPDNFINIA